MHSPNILLFCRPLSTQVFGPHGVKKKQHLCQNEASFPGLWVPWPQIVNRPTMAVNYQINLGWGRQPGHLRINRRNKSTAAVPGVAEKPLRCLRGNQGRGVTKEFLIWRGKSLRNKITNPPPPTTTLSSKKSPGEAKHPGFSPLRVPCHCLSELGHPLSGPLFEMTRANIDTLRELRRD